MKKHILYLLLLLITISCGISEDCFKGNGNQVTQTFPLEGFSKIKVYDGIGLVIKEGPNYEVKITTSDKIIDDIEVKLEGDMLIVKDHSTCNIARDYGQTTVYVTIPDGTNLPLIQELELHCKTEQKMASEGVLHSPIIRLYSIDLSDGAGTGDFHLTIDNGQLVVESNNVSNFYLSGQSENLHVFFSWGNGIFYGESLKATTITFYHRGSNDMILFPLNSLSGSIYSTGNVVLKKNPIETPNVIQHFTGRLIKSN
jgi:hypothetical protein